MMKILTWNVNSLKTLKQYHPWCDMKSFAAILDSLDADYICMQETKLSRDKIDAEWANVPGYDAYFSFSRLRKGYSGVVTYCKRSLSSSSLPALNAWNGFESLISDLLAPEESVEDFLPSEWLADLRQMDGEGRTMVTDHGLFVLLNFYCPNETSDDRMPLKMRFYHILEAIVDRLLKQGRHFIIASDINIVHREIDHCDPLQSVKDRGLKEFGDHPARKWLDGFLCAQKAIDLFRAYHPNRKQAYTCWNTLINARPINYGTRLDYILVDSQFREFFKFCDIQPGVMGSDHCPVMAEFIEDWSTLFQQRLSDRYLEMMSNPSPDPPKLCSCYFEEFSGKQKNILHFYKKKSESDTNDIPHPVIVSPGKPKHDILSKPKQEALKTKPAKSEKTISGPQKKLTAFFPTKSTTKPSQPLEQPPTPAEYTTSIPAIPDEFKTTDQIEARKQWATIPFGKPRAIPNCDHGEPCREYTVNKKGPNQGRKFYMCARPGAIDKSDINGRCNFFQWRSQSGIESKPEKSNSVKRKIEDVDGGSDNG